MKCYRQGGCGPYAMYSCGECPASNKAYLKRHFKQNMRKFYGFIELRESVELPADSTEEEIAIALARKIIGKYGVVGVSEDDVYIDR